MYKNVVIIILAMGFAVAVVLILLQTTLPAIPKHLQVNSTFTSMQVFMIIEGAEIRGFFTQESSAKKYADEHEGAGIFTLGVSPTIDLQMEFIKDKDEVLQARILEW